MSASTLAIAPIGTCRIHTPVRKGMARYPIHALLARNYGFVHTSAEALQQVRFMFGKAPVPADVQTLTFRPGIMAESYGKPYTPADLYLVELSSRKLLTVDDRPIQINYMTRYFGDFFADRERSRMFWSMASANNLGERRAWLDEEPVFKRLAVADRDLLARLLRRTQSDDDIEREMREIAELIGKHKLVFVTHVDATTPDNMVIEQRHRLIEAVRAIAKRMGVPCYDPTRAMHEVGQISALECGGLDLTHYTDEFAERVCADWYASYFAPRIGSLGSVDKTAVAASLKDGIDAIDEAANIETAWNVGHLCEASKRVRAVLRADSARADHRMLLARIQWEMGDYEGVIAVLESARGERVSSEKADQLLMRCYFEIGRYRMAQSLAAALMGDDVETPEILRVSAAASMHLGDTNTALANWKRLFRISDDAHEAAAAVLGLLEAAGDPEGAARWAHEVRETLPSHGPSYAVQWDRCIGAGDRAGLLSLAEEAISIEECMAIKLAQRASAQGFPTAAAALVVAQDLLASRDSGAGVWISRQVSQWLADGSDALEEGKLLEAAETIQAACRIDQSSNQAIRARRALERRLRQDARAALVAKDYAAVVAIVDIALNTHTTFHELDSFRGRAAVALGDTQTALHHLRRVADERDAPVSARIHLARVAVRGQHYPEALDAYSKIAANDASDQVVRDEAMRQLTMLRSRSIRAARELLARDKYDEAWALLDLLERSTPQSADVAQERKRVFGALHSKLRSFDSTCAADRMAIGETILRFAPADAVGLKAVAAGAMRLHRFAHALPYWYALRHISDNVEQTESNIQKCLKWIDRNKRKKDLSPAAYSRTV